MNKSEIYDNDYDEEAYIDEPPSHDHETSKEQFEKNLAYMSTISIEEENKINNLMKRSSTFVFERLNELNLDMDNKRILKSPTYSILSQRDDPY